MHSKKMTNGDIPKNFDFVMLIDENGVNNGKLPSAQALTIANEKELDLVVVGNGNVPVCKIVDFEKEQYKKKRKEHSNKHHTKKTKEIWIRPQTGEHDLITKAKQAEKFLNKGDNVKISLKFKTRQSDHLDLKNCIENFISKIKVESKKEGNVKLSSDSLSVVISKIKVEAHRPCSGEDGKS